MPPIKKGIKGAISLRVPFPEDFAVCCTGYEAGTPYCLGPNTSPNSSNVFLLGFLEL